MADFPRSLLEFQRRFSDDAACAAYLRAARWPDGFVCPACGSVKGWALATKAWTFECAACQRQTSVTAGTVLHGSKLPLTAWFWAAYLMATHSNGTKERRPMVAWTEGPDARRVLRGGSWNLDPVSNRAASRLRNYPDARYSSIGFRVARSLLQNEVSSLTAPSAPQPG